MDNLARAELYRDALHDLPDYNPAREAADLMRAHELAEEAYDRMSEEQKRDEWIERHIEDYVERARWEHT